MGKNGSRGILIGLVRKRKMWLSTIGKDDCPLKENRNKDASQQPISESRKGSKEDEQKARKDSGDQDLGGSLKNIGKPAQNGYTRPPTAPAPSKNNLIMLEDHCGKNLTEDTTSTLSQSKIYSEWKSEDKNGFDINRRMREEAGPVDHEIELVESGPEDNFRFEISIDSAE